MPASGGERKMECNLLIYMRKLQPIANNGEQERTVKIAPTRGAKSRIFLVVFQEIELVSPPTDQRFPLRFPFSAASKREQR
jgi:hypothetical protein